MAKKINQQRSGKFMKIILANFLVFSLQISKKNPQNFDKKLRLENGFWGFDSKMVHGVAVPGFFHFGFKNGAKEWIV